MTSKNAKKKNTPETDYKKEVMKAVQIAADEGIINVIRKAHRYYPELEASNEYDHDSHQLPRSPQESTKYLRVVKTLAEILAIAQGRKNEPPIPWSKAVSIWKKACLIPSKDRSRSTVQEHIYLKRYIKRLMKDFEQRDFEELNAYITDALWYDRSKRNTNPDEIYKLPDEIPYEAPEEQRRQQEIYEHNVERLNRFLYCAKFYGSKIEPDYDRISEDEKLKPHSIWLEPKTKEEFYRLLAFADRLVGEAKDDFEEDKKYCLRTDVADTYEKRVTRKV